MDPARLAWTGLGVTSVGYAAHVAHATVGGIVFAAGFLLTAYAVTRPAAPKTA